MLSLRHAIVSLGLCAVASTCLHATSQSPNPASITGSIVDPGGAAVAGATVELIRLHGPYAVRLVSDSRGHFFVPDVDPGRYRLRVERTGFRTLEQQVDVQAGSSLALSLSLSLSSVVQSVTVSDPSSLVTEAPLGSTQSTVSREDFKNTPATNVGDVLALVPGVTSVQGNGPRDVSISLRGSNERQTFGVRNVQVFEDGFPVTQPDGLARTDLTDPHAYSSIDVVQGPSSALYGNYATGGAINFHTRAGGEIQGLEGGADFGSFGYFNDYLTYGTGSEHYQVAAFLSNVRADQATANNHFNTITGNVAASFAATAHNRFTFRFINNDLDTDLSIRLSLVQYRANPFQGGCSSYTTDAASRGCATVSVFSNGYNGTRQQLTAAQAGLGRHDRRTIMGARYERDLTGKTAWQTQFVFDNRDINQPTSSTSFRGTYPSFNVVSGLLRRGLLWKHRSTSYGAGFFNYENINSQSANLIPGGDATLGGQTQTVSGKHLNAGVRGRQEMALAERWTLVVGLGGEFTSLKALANNFAYPVGGVPLISPVPADRTFFNVAPELAVQYHPSDVWRLHARLGTGYGTPQATQLFTDTQGAFGNNTTLKTQRNTGIDLGAELSLGSNLQIAILGFYEWFHNEFVTQSAGVNLQSYTFNAPSSQHRGVEAGLSWRPPSTLLSGWRARASYLLDNQIYTSYSETLTTGTRTGAFDRRDKKIPGVVPGFLNARLLYDQQRGRLRGFGGFLETNWRDNYVLDNANLLSAPSYTLLHLSTHYEPPAGHGALSRVRLFFDIQNLANRTYVGSAGNITNTLNAATGLQNGADVLSTVTGSIYAGTPRSSFGGIRVKF